MGKGNPNFRKMYNNFKRKQKKQKKKTKSNSELTAGFSKIYKEVKMLRNVNEALDIYRIDNDAVFMNAESSVEIYRITQEDRFTSKSVANAPNTTAIPQDAYRKGSELYLNKIDLYLQLINRQSTYSTRLMIIQFKDNRDIGRSIGGGGTYSADAMMTSNFAKWGIVGAISNPLVIGNPPAGRYPHFAGLMMKQPVKDVKDRYDQFYVLHDEIIYNPEVDQVAGTAIENQTTCFKRSVYPKLKKLVFAHAYDDSPVNDIIAIVFNNQPRRGKWQNPNEQVESTRGHSLNWTYKVYDN